MKPTFPEAHRANDLSVSVLRTREARRPCPPFLEEDDASSAKVEQRVRKPTRPATTPASDRGEIMARHRTSLSLLVKKPAGKT
jgi:hypothetical protein